MFAVDDGDAADRAARLRAPSASSARSRALLLWGTGGIEIPFTTPITLMNWYPLLTLPMFIFMGYILSESGDRRRPLQDVPRLDRPGPRRARDRHHRLMVVISAMNGLSVAGMAIGATIALPELLRAATTRSW